MTDEDLEYSLTEFCQVTRLNEVDVRELVSVGVIEPRVRRASWYFSSNAIGQCLKVERLINDLELTPHGAAIVLELVEQKQRLQRRLAYLERMVDRLSGQ